MRINTALIVLLLLLSSCQEKLPSASASVSQDNVTLTHEAGIYELTFSSNTPWKITSSGVWCKVFPTSGNGRFETETVIKLEYESNTANTERFCDLVIEYGNEKKTVPVKQKHGSIVVFDKEIKVGCDASVIKLDYWEADDNVSFETDPDCADWISILPQTKAMTEHTLALDVKENAWRGRTGHVYIKGTTERDTVEIFQKSANINFTSPSWEFNLSQYIFPYDADRDHKISFDEAATVEELDQVVLTAEELSYFSSLTKCKLLRLIGDNTHIDGNPKLKSLGLITNEFDNIMDIVISYPVQLQELDVSNCKNISSLDLSGQHTLHRFSYADYYYSSMFSPVMCSINLDGCSALEQIFINYGTQLSRIGLKDCKRLLSFQAINAMFDSIDLGDCPELTSINLNWCNNLTELDLTKNPKLEEVNFITDSYKKKTLYLIKGKEYKVCNYDEESTTVVYR